MVEHAEEPAPTGEPRQKLTKMIELIVELVVLGSILYLINARIRMPHKTKTVLSIVVVILAIIWTLEGLGFAPAPV